MATRNIEDVKADASQMRREWVVSSESGNRPKPQYMRKLWADYKDGLGDPLTPRNTWPIFKKVLLGRNGGPLSASALERLKVARRKAPKKKRSTPKRPTTKPKKRSISKRIKRALTVTARDRAAFARLKRAFGIR